jgi:hypothetical protein
MENPRIAILTLVIGADYRRNLASCLESKRAYAAAHNYKYFEGDETWWNRDRPIAWSKVLFWQHMLRTEGKNFDYFWISDADVLITNPKCRLEDHVLPLLPSTADLMWNKDAWHNINSGNMIFRCNSTWLPKFLDQVWNHTEDLYHIWFENFAMIRICETDKDAFNKSFINTDHKRFNAYLSGKPQEPLWEPSDFLVHYAGVYDGRRIKALSEEIAAGKVPRITFN